MAESVAEARDRFSRVLDRMHRAMRGELTTVEQFTEGLTPDEVRTVLGLIAYELERRARRREAQSPANRRAFALLRSFLTDEQRRTLDSSRYFHVRGSTGGVYRLIVRTGVVQRIERHGTRWFWAATFCLHDYAEDAPDKKQLPLADLVLQQMLLLMADEPAFLAAANLSTSRRMLWDGEWLRELRQAQRERDTAARAAEPRPRISLIMGADGEWVATRTEPEDLAA